MNAEGTMDVTEWLAWFLATLGRAVISAQSTLDTVLVKARFWERWAGTPMNERQVKLLNRLNVSERMTLLKTGRFYLWQGSVWSLCIRNHLGDFR